MILAIAANVILSIFTGIFGHLTFYPLIEGWHNLRIQRLARPSIGILLNAPVFVLWLYLSLVHFKPEEKGLSDEQKQLLLAGFFSYCASFLWNGAGVAIGYLLDDWRMKQ